MVQEMKEVFSEHAEGLDSVSVGLSRVARAADHDGWTCETSKTIEELQQTINQISAECYFYAGEVPETEYEEMPNSENWFWIFVGFSAGIAAGVLLMTWA
jgi:hypothetical protein